MTLKDMDVTQLKLLYAHQMQRDFPQSELKTLTTILKLWHTGVYDALGAYENGVLCAYALIYHPRNGSILLLDYLAVEPILRGRGLGGKLLELLRAHYAGHTLMIECERPKSAPDEALARKRIAFYTRCGALLTSARVWLFQVEYSVLVLGDEPINVNENWAEQILSMYRQMLPPSIFAGNIRLIRA